MNSASRRRRGHPRMAERAESLRPDWQVRRSFSLLRPVMDPNAQDRIRDAVLRAYTAMEQEVGEASAS